MIIVYASKTNNVKRFCEKVDQYRSVPISEYNSSMGEYILITYTDGFGEPPKEVVNFLEEYHPQMKGVCASGRQIWKLQGTYCKSADVIHKLYGVPILLKFEMAGLDRDRKELVERIERIEQEELH